jgi:hypothetical protein
VPNLDGGQGETDGRERRSLAVSLDEKLAASRDAARPQRLFLARVTAALRAASRRLRVVAALRPAARRFRVIAPFWPGVSVTLGLAFMVSLPLNGGEFRAKMIELGFGRMVRPATQRQPAIYRLATVCHN